MTTADAMKRTLMYQFAAAGSCETQGEVISFLQAMEYGVRIGLEHPEEGTVLLREYLASLNDETAGAAVAVVSEMVDDIHKFLLGGTR